jgi:YidC/Oxa1 family membrane protein insertase
MDRKTISILIVCGLLLVSWLALSPRILEKVFPPIPVPTNAVATASSTNHIAQGTNNQNSYVAGTNAVAQFVVNTNQPEETLVITNANARYTFSSHGGGIKTVELLQYKETVSRVRRRVQMTNSFATLNSPVTPPVMAILGNEAIVGDGVYKLSQTNGNVRAEKVLPNGLAVIKEFQLGTNYLVTSSLRFENRSKQPISVPAYDLVVGTATPMDPQDRGPVGAISYNGAKSEMVDLNTYFATNRTKMLFFPRTPNVDWRPTHTNVVWAAVQNQFFAIAAMPKTSAHGLFVRPVDLTPPTPDELIEYPKANLAPRGLETVMNYGGVTILPGQSVEQQVEWFAGPKKFRVLAHIAARFNNNIDDYIMGFTGFFGTFAKPLLLILNWLNDSLRIPYGWAIIVLTVTIKLIFWPLTKYSTASAKRMQALQPQVKAIQEKYKDEPQKASQKQMELFRKNGVNPLAGCLPMIVQVPVFFGLYRMLLSAIELRGAHFLWIGDLSKPDTLFYIPGLDFPFNLMPLLMGATMLWQSHLTPPSPGMDPAQQKMMRYLPLIMLIFLYKFSSGLALYWTVQNLLTVLQTKLTNAQPAPVLAGDKPAGPGAPQKKK